MQPDSHEKAKRLNLITIFLWKAPGGLTSQELARRLGVGTRTIQRDLLAIQDPGYGVPVVRRGVRWLLMDGAKPLLSALRLTLPEATVVVLAARLLQRDSDEPNPHVTTALVKLQAILPEPVAEYLCRLVDAEPGAADTPFVHTFEVLAQAWATRRTVHVRYRPASSTEELATDFDVYCLEPIAPSFAIYAVGLAHARGELRTLKLERIASAELTDRPFAVDPAFDAGAFLTSGWGIMGGSDLQMVRLRFAPEAVRRLRESRFHPSQELHDEPDGSCTATFQVAHPIELAAFIRGWGPRVEVLEPANLRELIAREAAETAERYGWQLGSRKDE